VTEREKLAYIAGFVDGEGSISTYKEVSGTFYPRLQVTNTVRKPLQLIADTFGGKIYTHPVRGNRRACFLWYRMGMPLSNILVKLMPFLIIQERRAALAIQLTAAPKNQKHKFADEITKLNIRGRG